MDISQLTARVHPAETERNRRFISRVIENSPLLLALDNFGVGATEDKYRVADGGQTLGSRAAGGEYAAEDLTPGALQTADLKFHGFTLDYDESYQKDSELGIGIDMDSWLNSELSERAIDVGDDLTELILSGDGQGDNILGLTNLLDGTTNVPGFGITMVIDATSGTNQSPSFDLSMEENYDLFIEQLEKWMAEIKQADVVICNRKMSARLNTIARKTATDGVTKDNFGNELRTILGMPIVKVDEEVIPNNEEDNAGTPNTDTTSMYLARNAEGFWTVRSNSGLATWDVGSLELKQSNRWKFEMRGFNEIKRKRAVRRVRNIKL